MSDDDALVVLIADIHKSAAEAVEMRRNAEALRARWVQNKAELQELEKTVGANSLDKVQVRRPALIVRRWPGVYGEPS